MSKLLYIVCCGLTVVERNAPYIVEMFVHDLESVSIFIIDVLNVLEESIIAFKEEIKNI